MELVTGINSAGLVVANGAGVVVTGFELVLSVTALGAVAAGVAGFDTGAVTTGFGAGTGAGRGADTTGARAGATLTRATDTAACAEQAAKIAERIRVFFNIFLKFI